MASYNSQKTMLNATPPLIVLIAASTYRSCCGGTLAQRLEQLEDSLAPHMLAASEGRPPPLSDLRGDEADVSKLLALRAVAMHIKTKGSMLYSEAATLACARRASFFSRMAAPPYDFQMDAPDWSERHAGCEVLARLPLLRGRER